MAARPTWPRAWKWLVGVQLAAIVFCGAVTVARFHIWAPIDERAHYAYIQELADHGRLPQIDDVVSWQVQAITDNTWPHPSPTRAETFGLAGRNYEAFQPPLYYLAMTPVFAVVHDYRTKVFALRAVDLALVLLAVVMLVGLARSVLPDAPYVGVAAALSVVLWPGVLVRGVTISAAPLELVLATALLWALLRADATRDRRLLLGCGVLLGACLLTKLTLIGLLVPFAIVLFRHARSEGIKPALWTAAIPAAVLVPWLVSNLSRFGTLTANSAAQRQQTPTLYPHGNDFGLSFLPTRLWHMGDGVLPQEWFERLPHWWVAALVVAIFGSFLILVIAAAIRSRDITLWLPLSALLAGLLVAVILAATVHWDLFLLRYFAFVLPALAIAAARTAYQGAATRWLWGAIAAQGILVGILWLSMAGTYYFTSLAP